MLFVVSPVFAAVSDFIFLSNQNEVSSCAIDVIGVNENIATAEPQWTINSYTCDMGTYLPAGDGWESDTQYSNNNCAACESGNYCIGGQYTYNESTTQGTTVCDTGYTSSAGASVCSPEIYNINYVLNGGSTYILNGGSTLPSGYTQLEYITFNFYTYIDTGYKFTSEIAKIQFDFNMESYNSSGGQMGGQNAPFTTSALLIYTNRLYVGNNTFPTANILSTGRHNVELSANSGVVTVMTDGQQTFSDTYTGSIQSTNSWPFGTYFTDSLNKIHGISGNLYSLRLYDNNVMVFDGIPARRNSDSELGVYDTVTNTFFTNLDTGTFVAGPDINTYTYGIGTTIDFVPTRDNSTFVGWCADANLTSCAATQTISTTATGDKTFYAKWSCNTGYAANANNSACNANTINLTWQDASGDTHATNSCSYGGTLTTPTTAPTRRGYTFTGWRVVTPSQNSGS